MKAGKSMYQNSLAIKAQAIVSAAIIARAKRSESAIKADYGPSS